MHSNSFSTARRLLIGLILALPAVSAHAANFTVTSTADTDGTTCGTSCTLRQAMGAANRGGNSSSSTISFDSGVFASRQTISLNGGTLPLVSSTLAINGPAAGVVIANNGGATYGFPAIGRRLFSVAASGNLSLSRLTLSGGNAGDSGDSTIPQGNPNNVGFGGAVYNAGTLGINFCTLSGNYATAGAAICNNGTLTVQNSTFAGNGPNVDTYGFGSVLYNRNNGTATLLTNTLSGNRAAEGNINVESGTVTLRRNTFCDNNTGVRSAALSNQGKLVAGQNIFNTGGGLFAFHTGNYVDEGYNFSGDPRLDPQGPKDNGGPTQTIAPLPGSPVINAGDPNSVPASGETDQRGPGFPRVLGGRIDIGAFEYQELPQTGASLVVNRIADTDDGVCGADDCTLREALRAAPNGATIRFDEASDGLSAGLFRTRQTITLSGTALPDVANTLSIVAPAKGVIVSGNGKSRIFKVASNGNLTLSSLSLSNGNAGSVVSGDSVSGRGGAIFNQGALTLLGCTLNGNTAQRGGALYQMGDLTARTITLQNVTLSTNTASEEGGGLYVFSGKASLESCTLTNGTSPLGSAIRCWAGDATANVSVHNSILSGNFSGTGTLGGDVHLGGGSGNSPNFTSNGFNLVGSGSAVGAFNKQGDKTGILNPALLSLADFGGPVWTHKPIAKGTFISPVVDAGKSALAGDARGQARPFDISSVANASGSDGSDIGAVELKGVAQSGPAFVVNSIADTSNLDGCTVQECTLRDAITTANGAGGASTISFDPTVFAARQTIALSGSPLPAIASQVTITGPTATGAGITLDGGRKSRFFSVNAGATLGLAYLTLQNGKATDSGSGGALVNSGIATLSNCTLNGNTASLYGAGIYNAGSSTLTLSNCTLSGNAASYGGALFNAGGTATLANCTLSGNTASFGSDIYNGGTLNIGNTILNSASDISLFNSEGTTTNDRGYNLTKYGSLSAATDLSGDAQFDAGGLQLNGGPTPTLAIGAKSPALNAGDPGFDASQTPTDQRGPGFSRVLYGRVDIGALELRDVVQSGPAFAVNVLSDTDDGSCSNFNCSLREAFNAANAYNASSGNAGGSISFVSGLTGTISLSSALPTLNGKVSVAGPGANVLSVAGPGTGGNFRLFSLGASANVRLSGLTLTKGNLTGAGAAGGAILVPAGAVLTADSLELTSNAAPSGGAIENRGTLSLSGSTLANNAATAGDGGALHSAASSTLSAQNSTFAFNTATGNGSAIRKDDTGASFDSLTAVSNIADSDKNGTGSGAVSIGGSLSLVNSIVTANTNGNVIGTASGSPNIVSGTSIQAGLETDSSLLPVLKNNGGPTRTVANVTGRAAVDKGSTTLTTDQRGAARPQGSADDLGAFEGSVADSNHAPIAVDDSYTIDRKDFITKSVTPNDSDPDGDDIASAAVVSGPSHAEYFRFNVDGVPGQFDYQPDQNFIGTDTFTYQISDGKLDSRVATVSIVINPPANPKEVPSLVVTTTADEIDSYDGVNSLREAVIYANSLTGNHEISFDPAVFAAKQTIKIGGEIRITGNVSVTGSAAGVTLSATSSGTACFMVFGGTGNFAGLTFEKFGQGINLQSSSTATVRGCTFSGNDTGIFAPNGGLEVQNSTLSGNTTAGLGIYSSAVLNLKNSTLIGNGVGIDGTGTKNVSNSIIAGNTTDLNRTRFTDAGYNLIGGAASAAGLDPAGLKDNGGPTQTIALVAGSPAINAGDPAFNGSGQFDQRGAGFPRVIGGRLDIGALESNLSPVLSIGDASVLEGNTGTGTPESGTKYLSFPLTLSAASSSAVTVTYSTGNGSATGGTAVGSPADADYLSATNATATIPAAQTTGTISIAVLGDTVNEPNETLTVTLSGASGANLGTSSALGTIQNDDNAPTLSLEDGSAKGSAGSMEFTLSLSNPSSTSLSVAFATSDGTAIAGTNYSAQSGTLTFTAGQTTKSITITGLTQTTSDKKFQVTLSSPSGATLSRAVATGTILAEAGSGSAATASGVTVTLSGLRRNRATGRFVQPILVKNNTNADIAGPLYLVLDNLAPNLSLYGPNINGYTTNTLPTGSPYFTLPGLNRGTSQIIEIEFVNPSNGPVSFQTRVLKAPGTP